MNNSSRPDWVSSRYDPDYRSLVSSFAEVVVERVFGQYQGDILFLLKQGKQRGLLVVGYGSCSGCDQLEAALSDVHPWQEGQSADWSAVRNLRNDLMGQARWFKSWREMQHWFGDESNHPNLWWIYDDEIRDALTDELKMRTNNSQAI
jgi:hypothetical protein